MPPTHPGAFNMLVRAAARAAARGLLRVRVRGIEHVPARGPLLLALNHLGGADPVLAVAFTPRPVAVMGKAEILRWPVLGLAARAYGMIPVRRGEVDRAALQQALAVLGAGGVLAMAPEGRESHTGALERGQEGAAFLAQRSDAPILPLALTGTAWRQVLPAWRRLRRPAVTVTFGASYRLPSGLSRRQAADEIMRRIAALLPPEYRGVYDVQTA